MEMNIVTVYDIQNKFIAYSAPFPDVIDVLSEWGCVYILGGDRKVCINSRAYQTLETDIKRWSFLDGDYIATHAVAFPDLINLTMLSARIRGP